MPQAVDEAGNIWEVDAQGNPMRFVGRQGGSQPRGITVGQPNNAKAQREAAAEVRAQNAEGRAQTSQDLAIMAAQRAAEAEARARDENDRKRREWEATHNPDGSTKPQAPALTAKERADAIAGYKTSQQLDRLIQQMEAQYKIGPGATQGVAGIKDYLPLEVNRQFDSTGNAARGIVGQALGFTGGQLNTAAEVNMAVGPYLPQSSDYDQVILDKIGRLRDLAGQARDRSVAILGGTPDQAGNIVPPQPQDDRRAAVTMGPGANGGGSGGNPGGGNPAPGTGGSVPLTLATGARYSTPEDIALARAIEQTYRSGGTLKDMVAAAKARGYTPNQQDAIQWAQAIQSRDKGNPASGVTPRQTGVRGVVGQIYGDAAASPILGKPIAGLIGAGNAFSSGGLDELAGAVNSTVKGTDYAAERDYANLGKQAIATANPLSYLAGELGANVAMGVAGGRAVSSAPRLAAALRSAPGLIGTGAIYGATNGALENNQDRTAGALAGAISGATGASLGIGGGAAAERFMRTSSGQSASEAARAILNRLRPGTVAPSANVPAFSRGERLIPQNLDLNAVGQNLSDATRLNLPYTLADADPALRNLAGSAARLSPEARAMAETVLDPRARGQADRAIEAINSHLAPVVDVNQRGKDLIEAGRSDYGPLYDQAYAFPPVTSPRIEQLLGTPAGREAVGKASTIAANELRDPKALGFAVDEAGNPVLNGFPVKAMDRLDAARTGWDAANSAYEAALAKQRGSLAPGMYRAQVEQTQKALADAEGELAKAKAGMAIQPRSGTVQEQIAYPTQSLDYTKRAIDDILEPQRNLVTGKLNLDEGGRAILGVKNRLLGEIDRLNPAYADARTVYGQYAKQAEALRTGNTDLARNTLPQADFDAILGRTKAYDAALPDDASHLVTLPHMQSGYSTAMADRVGRSRLSANPYDAVYGSTNQQQRVGQLFPQGSEDFGRIYGLERDMAKTRQELVGGSPTAARQQADASLMESLGTNLLDGISNVATGGGFGVGSLAKAALPTVRDKLKYGVGRKQAEAKATDLANILLNTDTNMAQAYLADLSKRNLALGVRKQEFKKRGGLFGAAVAPASLALLSAGE